MQSQRTSAERGYIDIADHALYVPSRSHATTRPGPACVSERYSLKLQDWESENGSLGMSSLFSAHCRSWKLMDMQSGQHGRL
jgi:hypothetical protein